MTKLSGIVCNSRIERVKVDFHQNLVLVSHETSRNVGRMCRRDMWRGQNHNKYGGPRGSAVGIVPVMYHG